MKDRRKTIGVLVNTIDDFYGSPISLAMRKVAEEKNMDLLFFVGGGLEATLEDERQHNTVLELVNSNRIDGVILFSATLSNFIGMDKFLKFIEKFRTMPMVSIGLKIRNVSSIIFDNKKSMELIVEHLIEKHNYSRIAYISGPLSNDEALLRYEGYKETLKKYNIPINENYIAFGNFEEMSGYNVINSLIENNSPRPEIIVCANDTMAIGAYYRLEELGIKVGKDIGLTGFDNIEAVKSFTPAFTTIRQPLFEMATLATEFISDIIDGIKVPRCSTIKSELIVRESCGCFNIVNSKLFANQEKVLCIGNSYDKECVKFEKIIKEKQLLIVETTMNSLNISLSKKEQYKTNMISLVNAVVNDIKNSTLDGEYLKDLETLLSSSIIINENNLTWNEAMYNFGSKILELINDYNVYKLAEGLFYKGSLLLSNILYKRTSLQQFNFKRMYKGTRDVLRGFNSCTNLEELKKVIINALFWYEINQFYLCIYDGTIKNSIHSSFKLPSKASMILGFNKGEIYETECFNTSDILPTNFLYHNHRKDFVFYSLFYGDEQYGYMCCDMNAVDEFVFETFREQISNALKMQILLKERLKAEEQINLAISELEELNKDLSNKYVIDELTGLFNRRGFNMYASKLYKSEVEAEGKITLFYGDIDGLKIINDNFGHKEGDEAIKNVSQILKNTFEEDDIIARIGGDEFTIISSLSASVRKNETLLNKIKFNFDQYNLISNKPYKLSISLGYSISTNELRPSFEELIQEADKKLYEIKKRKAVIK